MTSRVIIATPPDDIPSKDGFRILCVDLTSAQSQIVSDAIKQLTLPDAVIVYVWTTGNKTSWLLDKKQRSQLIVFNADSDNDLIKGYIAAQPNSYYFGTLRSLNTANNMVIYDHEQLIITIEKEIALHEKH